MIIEHATPAKGEPFLHLELRPNNSLSPAGFRLLMWVACIPSAVMALLFLRLNAWPVAFLIAIDMTALYWAFRSYRRFARHYEQLWLDNASLSVRCGSGIAMDAPLHSTSLEPHWLQLVLVESERPPRLELHSSGEQIEIGKQLNLKEKAYVLARLRDALARRKRTLAGLPA